MVELYNEDCLTKMKDIPSKSVDLILCDPPYGTTPLKWDSVLTFDELWKEYNRIIKDNGAIVLFATEPFATMLRASNIKKYR
jgi:site-specific DNA-methyltransferase (adenine-specific)